MATEKNETPAVATPKASIDLKGDVKKCFDNIRNEIVSRVPGMQPNNSDVVRYAMHLASEAIDLERSAEKKLTE